MPRCSCLVLLLLAAPAVAQPAAFDQLTCTRVVDSGAVVSAAAARGAIYETVIVVPDASWLRLTFDEVELGDAPIGGEETVLRVTSLHDGAGQTLDAVRLAQWQNTSAYLNGSAVRLEIVADPGAATSRVRLSTVLVGPPVPFAEESICGADDDRELSTDPRVARKFPSGCTAWLIDDANRCFLTAGHCTGSLQVVEFNVPLSTASGAPQHPGPDDQYVVDLSSLQTNGGQGVGNDWAYFGCFPNSNTDLTPFEAQQAFFVLADPPPLLSGQFMTVTGFGSTNSSVPPEWNGAQKTHSGPYAGVFGTIIRYETDTTGGNSGSPVINRHTGRAIGIHTHGGCSSAGGENNGTGSHHPGLVAALADPQGVCAPLTCTGDVDENGAVDLEDLLELLLTWGGCEDACPADFNGDGTVGLDDLLTVLNAWGPCP